MIYKITENKKVEICKTLEHKTEVKEIIFPPFKRQLCSNEKIKKEEENFSCISYSKCGEVFCWDATRVYWSLNTKINKISSICFSNEKIFIFSENIKKNFQLFIFNLSSSLEPSSSPHQIHSVPHVSRNSFVFGNFLFFDSFSCFSVYSLNDFSLLLNSPSKYNKVLICKEGNILLDTFHSILTLNPKKGKKKKNHFTLFFFFYFTLFFLLYFKFFFFTLFF